MDEFEIINASDCLPVIENKNALQLVPYYLCWYCNEGTNKGKLISPCNNVCFRKFMHVHCLEMLANTQKILNCQLCNSPYPLEKKCKSLLKFYRDRNELQMLLKDHGPVILNLYCLMFYIIFFISSIIYLIIVFYSMYDNVWHFIIIITIYLYIFVYSILKTLHIINFWSWRFYYVSHRLYLKIQEFKLIKQYENDCIQET